MSNTYNNFNYNPWETEEQRRQRLNGGMTPYNPNQTQTPYQASEQQQLTPRQMVEQAWDRSAAEQETKEKELEPMKNMSTREAIEYAWNKQEEKQRTPYMPDRIQTPYSPEQTLLPESLSRTPNHLFPYNNSSVSNAHHPQTLTQNFPTFDDDIISRNNSYLSNVSNWIKEKNRIASLGISDENKHQYMSCLASKSDPRMLATGVAAGGAKEIYDITYKLANQKQRKAYGGAWGVLKDSLKDMRNNGKGWRHGDDIDNDCQALLYHKLP